METTTELSAHLTVSALVVYLIERLKRSSLVPWLRVDTDTLNRVVSGILAAVSAFGITYNYDPVVGELVIRGLTWAAVSAAVREWLQQWVLQQVIYDATRKGRA